MRVDEDEGKAYLEVVEIHALTSSAAEAKKRLDAIKTKLSDDLKKAIDEPSIAARMNRYRALFGSHRSETLVAELGAELGAVAQTTPTWFYYDTLALRYLGVGRFNQMYPLASILRHGGKVTLGSDYPGSRYPA